MILGDVVESWLPKVYLDFNGFFVLCSNQSTLLFCRLQYRFSDYEAKRRKLTEAISLQYTVKGVLHWGQLQSGRKKTHPHTHTDIQRGSNKPYLKRGKKDKRRIRTKSIQWKLKRGNNAFTSKFKTFPSGRRTGKGEEDNDDYPADFSVTQGCHCAVSLVYYQVRCQIWVKTVGSNSEPLIPTQQLDTVCRSLICPQSRMLT